jgi:hypothetical protein
MELEGDINQIMRALEDEAQIKNGKIKPPKKDQTIRGNNTIR